MIKRHNFSMYAASDSSTEEVSESFVFYNDNCLSEI